MCNFCMASARKLSSCEIERKSGLQTSVSLKQSSNCLVLINYNNASYLHWTSSVATSEVAFPRMLFTLHRYFPLSFLLRLVIVKCFWSPEKLILESLILVSKGNLLMNHDIVGAGFPVALQDKVTLSPSGFVTFSE